MVVEDEMLYAIEISREGNEFVARVKTQVWKREYRNTIFEDLLREIVIDLQEYMGVD